MNPFQALVIEAMQHLDGQGNPTEFRSILLAPDNSGDHIRINIEAKVGEGPSVEDHLEILLLDQTDAALVKRLLREWYAQERAAERAHRRIDKGMKEHITGQALADDDETGAQAPAKTE